MLHPENIYNGSVSYALSCAIGQLHKMIFQLNSLYKCHRMPVLVLPHFPEDLSNDLMEWFTDSRSIFDMLKNIMKSSYLERTQTLLDMPKKARDIFWWPFTQHKLVSEDGITVIDSRYGENFAVFKVCLHYFFVFWLK